MNFDFGWFIINHLKKKLNGLEILDIVFIPAVSNMYFNEGMKVEILVDVYQKIDTKIFKPFNIDVSVGNNNIKRIVLY